MSIDTKNNSVTFPVNTKIYSKDIVYKACYVFIDRMYVFLDLPAKKDVISVTLKGKSTLTKKGIEKLEGEFVNELLNSLVRENVSKRNQKVLEQIVGGAMGAALGMNSLDTGEVGNDVVNGNDFVSEADRDEAKEIEAAVEALRRELEAIDTEDDYEKDVLGIRTVVLETAVASDDDTVNPAPVSSKGLKPKTKAKAKPVKGTKKPQNKTHAKKK